MTPVKTKGEEEGALSSEGQVQVPKAEKAAAGWARLYCRLPAWGPASPAGAAPALSLERAKRALQREGWTRQSRPPFHGGCRGSLDPNSSLSQPGPKGPALLRVSCPASISFIFYLPVAFSSTRTLPDFIYLSFFCRFSGGADAARQRAPQRRGRHTLRAAEGARSHSHTSQGRAYPGLTGFPFSPAGMGTAERRAPGFPPSEPSRRSAVLYPCRRRRAPRGRRLRPGRTSLPPSPRPPAPPSRPRRASARAPASRPGRQAPSTRSRATEPCRSRRPCPCPGASAGGGGGPGQARGGAARRRARCGTGRGPRPPGACSAGKRSPQSRSRTGKRQLPAHGHGPAPSPPGTAAIGTDSPAPVPPRRTGLTAGAQRRTDHQQPTASVCPSALGHKEPAALTNDSTLLPRQMQINHYCFKACLSVRNGKHPSIVSHSATRGVTGAVTRGVHTGGKKGAAVHSALYWNIFHMTSFQDEKQWHHWQYTHIHYMKTKQNITA